MTAALKPYPAVKDSAAPWLGEVPEHWEVLPALAAYRPRFVKNTGMIETTVLSLSYGRIIIKSPEKLRGLVPESFETYQVVDPGSIIVRTTDLQNDQTSLRVGHSKHRGIITSAYMCLETTPRISNEFGYQYLNAYDMLKIIYGFGSGLRQNLDFSDIKRMPVVAPPLAEQHAIVRFLHHADRRIRRHIRAKQRLIKLLEEQKQAIIHRAVTRGLDPNVPLKPSGVEWLGDIPEHWEVKKIKHCLRAPLAYGVLKPDKYDGADAIPIIRILDVSEGTIHRAGLERISPRQDEEFARTRVAADDVLISVVGTIGRSAVVPNNLGHANLSRALCRVQLNHLVLPGFLHAYCQSRAFMEQANSIPAGTAQRVLNLGDLRQFDVTLPPPHEQARILLEMAELIDALVRPVAATRNEIALLREYRTRLIADVVTGKLDVREAAAQLPEVLEDQVDDDEHEVEVDDGDEENDDDGVVEEDQE